MARSMMRAVRYDRYGPPEVLEAGLVPRPDPGPGRLIVRVAGAGVNPIDARVRSGRVRIASGRRMPRVVGSDFAGEVVETGPGVEAASVGTRVWGLTGYLEGGAAAEYVAVRADRVAGAPENLDLVEAAALPTVGVTALLTLDAVALRPGHRLLVIGASGGVGSAVVQLAAAAGAVVATLSSAANRDFCRELGAADAFDYAAADRARAGRYDAVIDCHGADLLRWRRRLERGGRIVSTATRSVPVAFATVPLPGPRVRMVSAGADPARLERLTGHVERGDLRPVIERVYGMDEAAEAHRAVETGHGRGKRVIRIAAD